MQASQHPRTTVRASVRNTIIVVRVMGASSLAACYPTRSLDLEAASPAIAFEAVHRGGCGNATAPGRFASQKTNALLPAAK